MNNVLFVVPSLSNGGAEKVVSKIASSLSNKGYNVSILNFYKCDNEYQVDNKIKRVVLSNGFKEDYNRIGKFKRIKLIRKEINRINPDKIVCFLNTACVYTFISLIFSKYLSRIVFTERCNPKYSSKIIIVKSLLQTFVNNIVVQNKGQQNLLSNKEKIKSYIIPNPVDDKYLEYRKEFNDIPRKIISIGRLSDQKDYPLAIKAFKNISDLYPDMMYHIYGQGEDKLILEELIKSLELEDKVILEGFTTDINKIYQDADIFLMTSKFEGMPNALAESLAVGLPCISMDCEFGPSDLIENEKMGILIKEHSVEDTTNTLIKIIEHYSEYVSNSLYIKEHIKNKYSLDKITEEWIKLIER